MKILMALNEPLKIRAPVINIAFDSRLCRWNFYWRNVPTMALGSTQSLTEMSTRNIFPGVEEADA
jgi:hypothetical protein